MSTTEGKDNKASKRGGYSYMELMSEWQLKNNDFSWMKNAACQGADPEIFFAESGWHTANAKAQQYCRNCTVYKQCMKFAIDNEIDYGIWGGLSPKQRRLKAKEDSDE
jgi:WhiB family redox-sensing transcriptional regulator